MITPMNGPGGGAGGPRTGNIDDMDKGKPMVLDTTSGTNTDSVGNVPLGDARGHVGWKENKEALQAETIHFAFDSATVRADDNSKLENVASYL